MWEGETSSQNAGEGKYHDKIGLWEAFPLGRSPQKKYPKEMLDEDEDKMWQEYDNALQIKGTHV